MGDEEKTQCQLFMLVFSRSRGTEDARSDIIWPYWEGALTGGPRRVGYTQRGTVTVTGPQDTNLQGSEATPQKSRVNTPTDGSASLAEGSNS